MGHCFGAVEKRSGRGYATLVGMIDVHVPAIPVLSDPPIFGLDAEQAMEDSSDTRNKHNVSPLCLYGPDFETRRLSVG
jgi:hypothetical protein